MTGSSVRILLLIVAFFALAVAALRYGERTPVPAPAGLQTGNAGAVKPTTPETFSDEMRVRVGIGTAEVVAEVAASAEKKAQGLSGREPLAEGEGMLFVFPAKGAYSFWNHEMRFALDLIWIDGDTVVDVSEHLPRFSGSAVTVMPSAPADKVLEVNAGFAQTHGITKGDIVRITQ